MSEPGRVPSSARGAYVTPLDVVATSLHNDGMFSDCVYCTKRGIPASECDLWRDHVSQAQNALAALDAWMTASAPSVTATRADDEGWQW